MSRDSMDPALLLRLLQERLGRNGGGGPMRVLPEQPGERPTDPTLMGRFANMPGFPGMGGLAGDAAPPSNDEIDEGRSRKYRSGGWELTGPMASFPNTLIHTPNPMVPLKFEQPPGEWGALSVISTELHSMESEEDFVSKEVMRAHMKALDAYSCVSWEEAVRVAQQALAISPICPEAYNVLALAKANTYEEALEFYNKAEELGPKVLTPDCWLEMTEEHNCWQHTPYRAYYRGLYGVANTLRKMGRYNESFAAYERLLSADGNWYSWSSYVNVMAIYPFVLLGAKGPRAVLEYMRNYAHTEEHFTYISGSVYWTGAYVLADLLLTEAKGTSVRAEGAKVTRDDNWAADGLDLSKLPVDGRGNDYRSVKTRPLFCFVHTYYEAVDFLLGDKAMLPGVGTICVGGGKTMAAASFAYTTGAQWRSNPSVLERLRRYRNTYEVRALTQDLRNPRLKIDLQELRQYMTAPGGFHTKALEREVGSHARVKSLMYTLLDLPDGREFGKNELKVLKWLIDADVPVTDTHPQSPYDQPLHMACYQGYGPEAVKLLLAAGADPMMANKHGLSALGMTANQGNWREMLAILQTMPQLLTANAGTVKYSKPDMFGPVALKKLTVPEAILMDLFGSSCLPCLSGGPKCMRCTGGIPHSPHADFFKCAEMLIAEADMRKISPQVLHEMEGAAKNMGPGSPWSKLQKYILRALDKQKKAPAAKKDPAAASAGASSSATPATSSGSKSSKQGKAAACAQEQPQVQSQPGPGVRQCWGCGKKPGADESLQKCSGCKKALYCTKECHVAHWKAHKADCKKWQQDRAAGAGSK